MIGTRLVLLALTVAPALVSHGSSNPPVTKKAPLAADTVRVDTIPDPQMENDNPGGGPNGLAYGIVGYTYGPGIDHPIAVMRRGSTNASVPSAVVVFPHSGWRGMPSLITDMSGSRVDCPIGEIRAFRLTFLGEMRPSTAGGRAMWNR